MFLNGGLYFFEILFGYINHLKLEKKLWCSPLNINYSKYELKKYQV